MSHKFTITGAEALLAPVYRDELALLNRVATSDSSSAERHEYARSKYEVD